MAEAITYADLRFVKAPLKKIVSSRVEEDPDAYDDGELTYENVQVSPVPGGASGLASSGLGDKGGLKSEQPSPTWSSVRSPPVGRLLPCWTACFHYLLMGLLLTCLLLGVAAICLGVRYLQVSQKLQQVNRVLETTNSSLRQQLHLKITQLGQKEEDLQESKTKLAQSQKVLQVEQSNHQATEGKLQACQLDRETTQETLQREEEQRQALEQRLQNMQSILKSFLTCSPPVPDMEHMAPHMLASRVAGIRGNCCPVGWILRERRCFYFSSIHQTWEESQNYCQSLSSKLAIFDESYYSYPHISGFSESHQYKESVFSHAGSDSYWIGFKPNENKWIDHQRFGSLNSRCITMQKEWKQWRRKSEMCTLRLPFICELSSFRFPNGDNSLQ